MAPNAYSSTQGGKSIAIGLYAAVTDQSTNSIAIG